jgi:hypothetical protein
MTEAEIIQFFKAHKAMLDFFEFVQPGTFIGGNTLPIIQMCQHIDPSTRISCGGCLGICLSLLCDYRRNKPELNG